MWSKIVQGRVLAAALVVVLASGGFAGRATAASGDDPAASRVTITEETSPLPGPCVSEPFSHLVLTRDVIDSADTFSLVVHVGAPLCTPIEVRAAVYAMPDDGTVWPQTLVEAVPFELQAQGTVTITFQKRCENVQFDVVEGDTPDTIAPTGPWHGPLLFAADTSTALQWSGLASPACLSTTPARLPPVLGHPDHHDHDDHDDHDDRAGPAVDAGGSPRGDRDPRGLDDGIDRSGDRPRGRGVTDHDRGRLHGDRPGEQPVVRRLRPGSDHGAPGTGPGGGHSWSTMRWKASAIPTPAHAPVPSRRSRSPWRNSSSGSPSPTR